MPKCIFSSVNALEVGMVKCALDENNINNFLQNYYSNISDGGLSIICTGVNAEDFINVIVKDEDVEKALEIINSLFINYSS